MYRIETRVVNEILDPSYVDGGSDYTIEKIDMLEDGSYYTQGFNKDGKVGAYCDDHLYIYGISNDERIICGASIGENTSKPDFTVEVIFEGIGKERGERKIFLRVQSSKNVDAYKINSDEDFRIVFGDIKLCYHNLSENFDGEYNRLMELLIPQLQACGEYLMAIGKRKDKVTDFKNQ